MFVAGSLTYRSLLEAHSLLKFQVGICEAYLLSPERMCIISLRKPEVTIRSCQTAQFMHFVSYHCEFPATSSFLELILIEPKPRNCIF
jgi:hypothetical protein